MDKQIELRLSGSGGQGIILAGVILAEAAVLDQKNAIQSQSYGPEARGGASKSEVIISKSEIDFPKVQNPDVILSLTQIAADKYIKDLDSNTIIVIDSSITLNNKIDGNKVIKLPIIDTARTKIGRLIVANIIAIGIITELTGVVSKEMIEKAILSRVPKGTEEMNKSALVAGYNLASQK